MKKVSLLLVLALGACMSLSAQDRIERAAYSILRSYDRYERMEKNIKHLESQIGIRRSGRIDHYKNYEYGIVEERIGSLTVGFWTDNYYVHIANNSVIISSVDGLEKVIPRRDYGNFCIANDVQCGKITGLRLVITNDRERTYVWLYRGNNVYKGFKLNQAPQRRPRVNVAPRRFK